MSAFSEDAYGHTLIKLFQGLWARSSTRSNAFAFSGRNNRHTSTSGDALGYELLPLRGAIR